MTTWRARPHTKAKLHARLLAPWLALANLKRDQRSAFNFIVLVNDCLDPRKISALYNEFPRTTTENLRYCARPKCQRLFYAGRKDQTCCTPRCAGIVRQSAYFIRRGRNGKEAED